MDNKARSLLDKINHDKAKSNFTKALKKVNDGLSKFPEEIDFYVEGADVCLESGEPLQAVQFLKRAFDKFTSQREPLQMFLREKIRTLGDPVLGKFLLEQNIRDRAFESAMEGIEDLPSRAVRDLLSRTRTKRQSLTSPASSDFTSSGKLIANKLCEAMLCLRLGRMKDTMRSFNQILEEKPVEAEQLESFLDVLSKKHAKEGCIRFTHAIALSSIQRDDKAMLQLVTAARLDSELVGECLDFIRNVSQNSPRLPEAVDSALVELLLISGDVDRAVNLLRERLENDPGAAVSVMEIITYNVDRVEDSLALKFLYIDTALDHKQPGPALEMIKSVGKNESTRMEMYEWLASKSKAHFLPTPVLVYQGELAILEGKIENAIEVFTAVCGNSPSDVSDVITVVERHMKVDQSLRSFYEEHSASGIKMSSNEDSDGLDVERFQNTEFSVSSEDTSLEFDPESTAPTLDGAEVDVEPGLDRFDGVNSMHETINSGDQPTLAPLDLSGSSDDALEHANDTDDVILWDEEDEETAAAACDIPIEPEVVEDKVYESLADDEAIEDPIEEDDIPEITEAHINNVAEALYASGANTFFHVDENKEVEAESAEEDESTAEVSAPVDDPDEIVREQADLIEKYTSETKNIENEEPIADTSYAGRLAMFRAGSLDNNEIVSLIEEAFDTGRMENLGDLLEFEPRNAEEQFMRKRYQVEVHVVENYPAAALDILDTVNTSHLSDDETRFVRLKSAICHQMMNNYESAHEILLKMSDQFPDDEDIKQLARRNYEQLLKSQIDDSPTLEKATFVATDS